MYTFTYVRIRVSFTKLQVILNTGRKAAIVFFNLRCVNLTPVNCIRDRFLTQPSNLHRPGRNDVQIITWKKNMILIIYDE
jgi:hypothetical protein